MAMHLADDAIVLTLLPHGEHGAVVRFLGLNIGMRAGFVRGGRGRRMRAIIHPGNRVALNLSARTDDALPSATVEPVASRALVAFQPGPALALGWLTELTAATLSEAVPHPRLAEALDRLLDGLAAGLDGRAMLMAVARYELLLLQEEGLGLDLTACALGGPAADLGFVSPRTGRAVSRDKAMGQPWADRLLPLPLPLRDGGPASAAQTADALRLTGHFLSAHWLQSRERLSAMRRRLTGLPVLAPATSGEPLASGAAADKAGP